MIACEPVIQRQGYISMCYSECYRICLVTDGWRVMACDRLFRLTCRKHRENSPEGRKETGRQIQGEKTRC